MRKKIIAGNWKMNKTPTEAEAWAKGLSAKVNTTESDVVFCVPFIDIIPVAKAIEGTNISVGAQNLYFEEKGAFTGEISPEMLVNAGVKYVIIGHSERRKYFAETDADVNKKVVLALKYNITPIVCVGETLEQRKQHITIDLVRMQTKIAFQGILPEDAEKVVVAYEPIWAIGSGLAATKEEAEEVCAAIRKTLAEIYCEKTAQEIRIQYGGSVDAKNASEIFNLPNVDGGLVGGASLKPDFEYIVHYNR